jgi:hypothetical protein
MSTNINDLPYTTPTIAPQQPAKLPERDIPRETIQHTVDPQANVQYMPPRPPDYIPPAPPPSNRLDYNKLLEEFRVPILLSLLYFLFQLDSFQALLRKVLPMMFSEAGVLTSKGIFIKSGLYGASFYVLTMLMEHFSRP